MQTDNRFFDDLAKLATGAAGALTSVRSEAEGAVRAFLDRRLGELDLVTREEFDAVKEMAAKARAENDRLNDRLKALEDRLAEMSAQSGPKKPATTAGKAADKPVQAKPATGKTSANKTAGTRSTGPKTD
ncbi:hypothetical protein JCM17846_08460 [Iodidimonas nitroreducens]|uniref:Pyrroline-5-carboxylate reductase n=1 Tax=Iodidimonas nitroreducens TaxID=1236968 RepID=A0A5A7N624_9PROT|nr:accessory factor UbiK family protein [Iodidimonas nitroreducens]GAK32372.1 membrane fusogenic activity [alpha proteobacterium Q-1]GER03164.1 hypothetical protein JCM17846_08460 [Iodidimonas nitroreducens]